ncbi:MAG: hypothetical protein ACI8VR_003157, partial [Candidatus Azotimanducaceae bacterium]
MLCQPCRRFSTKNWCQLTEKAMLKVGFIGLGNVGGKLAGSLL